MTKIIAEIRRDQLNTYRNGQRPITLPRVTPLYAAICFKSEKEMHAHWNKLAEQRQMQLAK